MKYDSRPPAISRRQMLQRSGLGFGSVALAALLQEQYGLAVESTPKVYSDLKPRPGQMPAKAKAMIQLFQNGGPSQMDLFDPKPDLNKRNGETITQKVETFQPANKPILLGGQFPFKKYGKSGMELADIIPHLGSVADELCLIRSMYTEHNNHPEGVNMMETCKIFPGRPVLGSWISYALGT